MFGTKVHPTMMCQHLILITRLLLTRPYHLSFTSSCVEDAELNEGLAERRRILADARALKIHLTV